MRGDRSFVDLLTFSNTSQELQFEALKKKHKHTYTHTFEPTFEIWQIQDLDSYSHNGMD